MILLVLPPIPAFTYISDKEDKLCCASARLIGTKLMISTKWKRFPCVRKLNYNISWTLPQNLIVKTRGIGNHSFRLYKISSWSMYSTVRLTIEIFLEIRRYACTWWVYTSRGSSVTWNTGLWILVRYYARYVSEPPVALDFGTINGIHVRWIHTSMARRFASNVNELIYVDVSYIVVQVGRLEFRNLSSESQKKREEFCRYVVRPFPPRNSNRY